MLIYTYILLTLMMGGSALWNGAVYAGVAGIVGATMCWFAASGLKGSLMVGTRPQKIAGFAAAVLFIVIGMGVVYHSGFWIGFFGYEFSGVIWCLIGLAAGWIATKRRHAE
ncbi:MAG: hypothetical protein CAF44_012310 [Nitrospira sp. CG24D]|nr:MAG: hypothetical protein CAF44_012310 [Nitrospira sp. CG24D]